MIKRIFVTLAVLVVVVIGALAIYVASRQNLRFDVPEPPIVASTDSAVIARGRYIVRDVAACGSCHATDRDGQMAGAEVSLSGGYVFDIPPGKFYARNITPDPETGIGKFTDGAIARALRHGVGNDRRALLPFMEMQGLSDEDLVAVVSYLRTQPPVHNVVPAHSFNLLGKVVKATVLANPVSFKAPPPGLSPRGATVMTGSYLAGSVANCWSCHTPRNQNTGELEGPLYAGTTAFTDPDTPDRTWSPPNLTSDPKTGRVGRMTEDQFVARMRAGRILPGSPMPWQGYQRMTEDDLRGMYRFLKSLPPVEREVGPAFVMIEKK